MTQKRLTYVALGDSTGVGYGAQDGGYVDRLVQRLLRRDIDVRVVNLCRNGATASDVAAEQLPRVAELLPDLVTVAVGVNDLAREIPDEAFALHLEEIAVGLRTTGARVVLANLPDLTTAPVVRQRSAEHHAAQIELYNRHIEATAARHSFALVDLHRMSRRVMSGHPELYSRDGFHPSDKGYERWTDAMWPVVGEAVGL